MSFTNANIVPVKTDEDIISAVAAKSHLIAGCYGLDDNDTVNLADKFGHLTTVALGASPLWNSANAGEPDGFAEFDASTAAANTYYAGDGTDVNEIALFNTKDITGNLILNLWINSPTIGPAGTETFFVFGSGGIGDGYYELRQTSTDIQFIYTSVKGTVTDTIIVSNTSLSNDTWHMVTVDISAAAVTIYLDGQATAKDSYISPPLTIHPVDNGFSARALGLFAYTAGGSASFKPGLTTRTVYLSKLLAIKSTTSIASSITTLISGLYRKGVSGLAPEIADL